MPDGDYSYKLDPVQSKDYKDGEPRVPRSHKDDRQKGDARDPNRRKERQEHVDRSRTSPPNGNEHHSSEKRPKLDRNPRIQEQERARDHRDMPREDRSRQQRHMEDRRPEREEGSRDRYREERSRQQRHLEDKSSGRQEESQDRYREEKSRDRVEKSRYRDEGTQDRHREARSQDKLRGNSRSHERDRYWEERGQSLPRDPKEMDFHQESTYYKKDAPSLGYGPPPRSPSFDEREYYESQPEGGILECNKCRYLCTGRACCQMVEVLLNMLILVCASVSYNSTGGFTGITNMGGIYYYAFGGAYSGFQGADGETAQKLDVQFYQLKLPTVTASMAFGGTLMSFSCLMILIGVFRLPWHFPVWLLVESVLDILIAFGYLPALYFYFRKLLDAYETQVCKDREALYKSKGYEGFSCALHGADIAAGLFGCMSIGVFILSAVLAVRGFRRVRLLKQKQPVQLLEL